MSQPPKSRSSFSPVRRWGIGFDMALRTLLVAAVVVMLNYIGASFYHRFFLSSQTSVKLSTRTIAVLNSMTNKVAVTLYFDTSDEFYPDVVSLLDEYHAINKNVTVRTVDFIENPGEAEKVKAQYKLGSSTDKDLVIFDSNGRWKTFPGEALTQMTMEQIPNPDPEDKRPEFRRKPVAFSGEKVFTAMLLALQNSEPLKAYFLQGDGEPSLTDNGNFGYMKFASELRQNDVTVTNLELLGTNTVPADCNLLVITAPAAQLAEPELQKISQYLAQGGRLMVLFNYASLKQAGSVFEPITGLEPVLQRWGINVLSAIAQDPQHTVTGQDIQVRRFGQHPVVNSLADFSLQMVLPRPVEKVNWNNPPANAPAVTELAFTSSNAVLAGDSDATPRSYSLIVAVEQKPAAGVANPRGNTRIIVTGDSTFLGNYYIDGGANRDFLDSAVNWLVDRPQLVEGIGPKPVTEYRLMMTRQQQRQLLWVLIGALPGGALFLGCLVWLVRRK